MTVQHRVFPSTICQISDTSFLHTEHDEVQKNKIDFRQCVLNHKACPWLNVYDQIYSLNAQNEVKQWNNTFFISLAKQAHWTIRIKVEISLLID